MGIIRLHLLQDLYELKDRMYDTSVWSVSHPTCPWPHPAGIAVSSQQKHDFLSVLLFCNSEEHYEQQWSLSATNQTRSQLSVIIVFC